MVWGLRLHKNYRTIDFCVRPASKREQAELFKPQSFLWAEVKTSNADISKSLAQLVLTIGKARTFTGNLPPKYLGVFDTKKIAFIEYHLIQDIFNINDFNWNVPPQTRLPRNTGSSKTKSPNSHRASVSSSSRTKPPSQHLFAATLS